MGSPDQLPNDLETTRERLNVVTQETRFSLLQDIIGPPEGLPTLKELDFVNPSKGQTTIRQQLQVLVDADIVEEVLLPKHQRSNDRPYKFYGLSDDGREFLQAHTLLRARDTLRAIYDRVEKPNTIERFENAPRSQD